MKTNERKEEQGNAIIIAITVMAVLAVAVATAVEYTMNVGRNVDRSSDLQSAIAIGDGALESAFSYWRELCRVNTTIVIPNSWNALIPLPTGGALNTQFPDTPNFSATTAPWTIDTTATISNFGVTAATAELVPLTASTDVPVPSIGQAVSGAVDITTTHAVYNWIASAYVTLPTIRGNRFRTGAVVAKVQRVFQKEQISPWNYAIFYVDDLEIHPGAPFTVTGPVHTNAYLYTASSNLTFMDKATFAVDWKIAYKDGRPNPTSPKWPANLPPSLDIAHQPFGLDAGRIFNTTDNNPNNDSYHEVIEPPIAGSPDPLLGQRYYDQATLLDDGGKQGVMIQVDSSNVWRLYKGSRQADGSITLTELKSSSSGSNKELYDMFKDAITTKVPGPNNTMVDVAITDQREGANVRITTLDVSQMLKSDGKYEADIFNGLIYMMDTSADPTGVNASAKRGFRIKNAKIIPSGGMTIASNNPVYLQGDFNTGYNPPSDSGLATDANKPEGVGATGNAYKRAPCSVLADAVTILSNAFTDSKLTAGYSGRIAAHTTVNTAIVSGMAPTVGTTYGGGVENFPRFLENWGSQDSSGNPIPPKAFTYYGSMVELYASKQAIGNWGKSNVYSPPIRQWNFDTNFKFSAPPGSLMIYSYVKGRWSLAP